MNEPPKQCIVVTSPKLIPFAENTYQRVFNSDKVPKDGVLCVDRGIYRYSVNGSLYYSEEASFEGVYKDIRAIIVKNKTYRRLGGFTKDDRVMFFADFAYEYSQHILWELHHEFDFPLSHMFYVRSFEAYNHVLNRSPYYDVKKRLEVFSFSERMVRTMVALSLMKLALYQYSKRNLYGPPLNLASMINIKMTQETEEFKSSRRHAIRLAVKHLDISVYSVKYKPGIGMPIKSKRLYDTLCEDIQGFTSEDFIPQLIELRDLFATGIMKYPEYKKTLEIIFKLEEDQL